MSSACSSMSAAAPSAFGAATGAFAAFAPQAPASAATAAATAASSSTASPPPSTAAFGAFAGMGFPADPVQPSPFTGWPAAPAFASGFGFPSFPLVAPFAQSAPSPAAAPARVWSNRNQQFVAQLTPHLQTRAGVFALNWYEVSAAPPRSTLLMRYLAVGEWVWRESMTPSGHDEAHGWIVEKLAAELAEGHGYNHHDERPFNDRSALAVLLSDWILRPQLVLSMAPVLLAAPSVAVRLREGGDRRETTRLVEALISNLDTYPDRLEPCLAIIATILERGGLFDQALQAIIAKSHIQALLHVIKAATEKQLQSVSLATLHQARQLEQQRPYSSLRRLCRELIERVCEWQAAEDVVGSLILAAIGDLDLSPGVPCSSSSSLAALLSAFESALPSRMLAHQCMSRGCSEAEWLAALAQFDWLDLAEEGVMRKLLSMAALRSAATERVQQLAARERARAADEAVSPASGPLSPPAIIAHLIRDCLLSLASSYLQDPTNHCALLLALVPAASVVAGSSSSSGGLCIPGAFDLISRLPDDDLMRVALAFHEAGIFADDHGSLALHLIRRGRWATLQRWMAPEHARFSMPIGWLGERDTTLLESIQSAARSAASLLATPSFPAAAALPFGFGGGFGMLATEPARAAWIPGQIQPHPHLAAGARCDVWDAACRRAQSSDQDAPIQQLMSHAIDWHYATVTPQLRSALSAHLLPELHAEVLSCLMPPSTLRDPAASPAAEADPSLPVLHLAVAALLPSHSALAEQLRQVHQRLIDVQHRQRDAAVERGFAERALEAERQMTRLLRLPR